MNEERKTRLHLMMMDILDEVNEQIMLSKHIQETSFDRVSPELWADIQKAQERIQTLLAMRQDSLRMSSKVIDNDALWAHLRAVADADD